MELPRINIRRINGPFVWNKAKQTYQRVRPNHRGELERCTKPMLLTLLSTMQKDELIDLIARHPGYVRGS